MVRNKRESDEEKILQAMRNVEWKRAEAERRREPRASCLEKSGQPSAWISRSERAEPESIQGVLKREVRALRLDRKGRNDKLMDLWNRVAGPEIAARTRVRTMQQGILHIEVDDAVLRYELQTFHHHALLESLRAACASLRFREIRFLLESSLQTE